MKITKIEPTEREKVVMIYTGEYPNGVRIKLTQFENVEEIKAFLKERYQSRLNAQRRFANLDIIKKDLDKEIGKTFD